MRTVKLWDLNKPIRQRHNKNVGPYYMQLPPLPGSKGWKPQAWGFGGYLSGNEFREGSCVRLRVKPTYDIVDSNLRGYYYNDCLETIYGVVAILPHKRGFLAGWTMGDGMATCFERDIHDSMPDAAYIADSLAETAAENQRIFEAEERAKLEAEEREQQEKEDLERLKREKAKQERLQSLSLDVDAPDKVAAILRNAANAYRESFSDLAAAWQDDKPPRVWVRIANALDQAANKIDKFTE